MLTVLFVAPAFAGWQYGGYYVDDGMHSDDGTRFIISGRGGLSWANAKVHNDVGNLYGYYYIDETTGEYLNRKGDGQQPEPKKRYKLAKYMQIFNNM